MRCKYIRNSQGVALLAALFVLMVLSILGIGLLTNVDDDLRMSKSVENSEKALKVAEAGIQMARSTFFDPGAVEVIDTQELSSIDGFYRGGYFLAQLESGFRGEEKWVQWRYDEGVTGHNPVSEITAPVFHVWQTSALGVNGTWSNARFNITPIYGIVARGTYFPIEDTSGNTEVRAHDEYTGAREVDSDYPAFATDYWIGDKALITGQDGLDVKYAINMSPMVSFSNYSSGGTQPVLVQQKLYFTYAGSGTDLSGSADRSSTVRLRAVNAQCHGDAGGATYQDDGDPMKSLWEFNTGIHGIGTAPAFFDPDPDTYGDEILYFAVVERGKAGSSGALDLKASNGFEFDAFPSNVTDDPEQIYLFAVVDTTGKLSDCTNTGSYKLKWAHPFPDPDVVEWTDYPAEQATGTDGTDPPYIRRPSDMTPFLPEEDLLADYRDGPGISGRQVRADGTSAFDGQWNQMRGNLMGRKEPGVSPPVVKVLYRDSTNNLTELQPQAADPFNPIIDIYLMYSALTRISYLHPTTDPWVDHVFWDRVMGFHGDGWGDDPGYRKPNTAQVRLLALRDAVVSETDAGGNHTGWNWNDPASRYPIFKWTVPVSPWDPDQTHASPDPDDRPGRGYGEYTWDTWFPGLISPMINTLAWDQDGTSWASVGAGGGGGAENLYNVIYSYYKSAGFHHGGAYINDTTNGRRGPNTGEGSPVAFEGDSWADSRVMAMAYRDTWDDYMQGNRTNIIPNTTANPDLSNPVEPYWTHTNVGGVGGTPDIPLDERQLITYEPTLNAPYRANAFKVGFPRPYAWWEALWEANVKGADPSDEHSLYRQGWAGVISPIPNPAAEDSSKDLDVEGEAAAMCPECLFQEGLLILSLNHDLTTPNDPDREDLRIHGINATTGLHVWDYHIPTTLEGDDANTTPAIANNLVFVAYQNYSSVTGSGESTKRRARLLVLDADNGIERQQMTIDERADAVILPPTIANGAVYVGTYDYSGDPGVAGYPSTGNNTDDVIRLWAMSPVIRLVSTGIYPFDDFRAEFPYGYRYYTSGNFANITMLDHDTIFKNPTGEVRGVWKRKLQVWVTGQNSKWEEVRELLEE